MTESRMTHASLFSGFGAPDLAALWMGWDNAFWCETDNFCRQILKYWFPKSKGYGNIKETDFTPWRGKIDILTGGFPCQPFSVAGQRKGSADDRYLWPEMLRAIREIRPAWVIGENVAGILSMVQSGGEITVESQASLFEEADKETLLEGEYVVETVCRSLEEEGYSVQPVVIPACAVGAPHRRDRVFFIANRADARIESLRPERENAVYGFETSSDTDGHNAGRSGYGKTGCKTGGYQKSKRQRERLRSDVKRDGGEKVASNSNCQQLENARRTWNRFSESTNLYSRQTWQDFPTQSPLRCRYDGISYNVVRYINQEVYDEIKKYIRREDLSCVWEAFQAKEIREKIRRLYEIPAPDLLLEVVQRTAKEERPEQRSCGFSQFSEKTSEKVLHYLRKYGTFGCSPLGWKYQEQFSREFGNTLPSLSHEIALATKKIVEECESTATWVALNSIKGYGNAIVPQVMYEIFKAIEQTQELEIFK